MNIYVGNLSYSITEESLREIFGEFGTVTKANLIIDRETGNSKGFGFVEMATEAEGDKAIAELDGKSVEGRNLRVNKATPKTERPRQSAY